MTHTITVTEQSPILTLHLRPRELREVLDELERSDVFTPEEQETLAAAMPHFETRPRDALTYVILYVVQAAMCRYTAGDPEVEARLFAWENELFAFLQTYLPQGMDAEEFVQDRSRFEEVSTRYEAARAPFREAMNRARERGNAAIDGIARTMHTTASALERRIQILDGAQEETARVYNAAQRALAMHERLLNEAGGVSQALNEQKQMLENILGSGEDVLRELK